MSKDFLIGIDFIFKRLFFYHPFQKCFERYIKLREFQALYFVPDFDIGKCEKVRYMRLWYYLTLPPVSEKSKPLVVRTDAWQGSMGHGI